MNCKTSVLGQGNSKDNSEERDHKKDRKKSNSSNGYPFLRYKFNVQTLGSSEIFFSDRPAHSLLVPVWICAPRDPVIPSQKV